MNGRHVRYYDHVMVTIFISIAKSPDANNPTLFISTQVVSPLPFKEEHVARTYQKLS